MADTLVAPRAPARVWTPVGLIQFDRGAAVLFMMLFYSGVTVWSFDAGVSPIAPNRWLAVFAVITIPVLLPRGAAVLGRSPLMMWLTAYLAITAMWFVVGPADPAAVEQVRFRLYAALFIILAHLVFADARTHRPARLALAGCVAAGVLLNFYDLAHPLAFSPYPGRAAGFYENPNISGAALTMGMIVAVGALRGAWRSTLVVLTGFGVAATQSRGAALTYVIAVALLVGARQVRLRRLAVMLLVSLVAAAIVVWVTGLWRTIGDAAGLRQLVEMSRLTSASGDVSEGDFFSTQSRLEVARHAWLVFTQHPWLGGGLGVSGYTVHNMYLMHAADNGVMGLLIYPGFAAAVAWKAPRREQPTLRTLAVALLVWGMFSHNVLDEMDTLAVATLAASMLMAARAAPAAAAPSSDEEAAP